ncbi:hypothetical protein [Muricoccus radiodurans]|uniref:hypothetical protein n=1 Tax=Muricoccus radiodurans TaxID=2231721 RepID=UPI003CFAA6E0
MTIPRPLSSNLHRGTVLVLLGALALAGPGLAQGAPPQAPQPNRQDAPDLWFDPTQLPSFTGTVERYLVNPRGETDALLFREGVQVSFPPDIAQGVREAAPAGRPLTIWGIRSRRAPVVTMLAFAPNGETTPVVVDRFYWRIWGRGQGDRAARITVQGVVRTPYFAPQGEVAGAVLEDGAVIMLPRGAAASDALRDLLKPGARISAEGMGYQGDDGRAVAAEQLGEAPDSMRPVPRPEAPAQQPNQPARSR